MAQIPHANYTLTKRFTNVGSLGQAISFKEWAIKGIAIHFEGSTCVGIVKGSGTVTGSGDAHLTSDGITLTLDGMWDAGDTITTLYTPTANGSDKIVNGAMATDSGVAWAKGTGWVLNGVATHTTGNATTLVETTSTVVNGEQYLFVYTLASTTTAGVLTPSAGGVTLTTRTGVLALPTTVSPSGGSGCTIAVASVSSTGEALTVTVVAGGTGYAVGDVLSVTFAAATRPLKLKVLTLSTTAVATVIIVDNGLGYEVTGASKTYSEEFTAISTAKVTFTSDATWAGTIDDVKMYRVYPCVCSIVAWR